MRSKISTS